jgi:hypothetical protein
MTKMNEKNDMRKSKMQNRMTINSLYHFRQMIKTILSLYRISRKHSRSRFSHLFLCRMEIWTFTFRFPLVNEILTPYKIKKASFMKCEAPTITICIELEATATTTA